MVSIFDVLFLFSSLVACPIFMSVSLLVLEIMTVFFYKGSTRNPEIGNTLVRFLPNIWRLGRVRDIKFSTDVSYEMLLNAAN